MYIHYMVRMVRKQIYLTLAQERRLRQEAARQRRAEAEIIRDLLDRELAEKGTATPAERDPFWDIIGLGSSGLGDLSEDVDHHLYGAAKKPR